MILLLDVKGSMQLDRRKDVCACFNFHQLWCQHINTSYLEVVMLIRRMFLRLVTEMNDQFLERRINIKVCVKLGKNVTLVECSPRPVGEKLWKSSVFMSGINSSKRTLMSQSQMNTICFMFFDIKDTINSEFIPYGQLIKLIMWKYWSDCMKLRI